ncbi:hypothetical protein [Streptomyces sp. NPDC059909]|uniref:hypothetical protein n=1 Tax=Streptomyces sp. NPDC059909 TaxID=3346998 RepID=UPI003648FDE8
MTVAIRAARGGVGNITGIDLRSLKPTDPAQAVADLRGLGRQIPDLLLDADPETPVLVTVPALTAESDHPLPFGTQMHSWGWDSREASAVLASPPGTRMENRRPGWRGTFEMATDEHDRCDSYVFLKPPAGTALLQAWTQEIKTFLQETEAAVPREAEPGHVDLDALPAHFSPKDEGGPAPARREAGSLKGPSSPSPVSVPTLRLAH